ncbi:MAG: VOC family protein [Terriglobales bacterium]
MQGISPSLWFDGNAEEAANFYVSVFKNSKIKQISRYAEGGPGPAGSVMVVVFELGGREFLALNDGPMFKFTEAVSFVVNCENQQEIDYYWDKLTADRGKPGQCGSWQIVPTAIGRLMSDSKRAPRVMAEVMKMTKLDLKKMAEA